MRTHLLDLYVNGNNRSASHDATNFYSFGVEHIPKQIKKFMGKKYHSKYLKNTIR